MQVSVMRRKKLSFTFTIRIVTMNLRRYCTYFYCLIPLLANAQKENPKELRWLKHEITTLSATNMKGRGYAGKGHEKAAHYLERRFKELGLAPMVDSTYVQRYSFPVNTFPDDMMLKMGKKELVPGAGYIIDVASRSFHAKKKWIHHVDMDHIKDTAQWEKKLRSWKSDQVHLLKNVDSFCKRMNMRSRNFARTLPEGCYIIPQHGKLTWDVATDTMKATAFYVEDTIMPRHAWRATVSVHNVLLPEAKNVNENIIGLVPGAVDSYIVFSAHYDHLGMMGKQAMFPGASDNASGTAMMLYLASYFAQHPQHYTMVFMAFSGEEAGLLGSHYFVQHPMIPLERIRFLTNLDIMGDATNGVTVVNATEFPKEFSLLQNLNSAGKYLPDVKSRGKAANSDHYHFTEAGVPSFFIYTNGGKGFYHDIFDKADTLSMTHIPALSKLLIDFAQRLNQ